jgi:NAD(P)-dependent dehydrogenase (short-subunit alcohol dehydrogenase family)
MRLEDKIAIVTGAAHGMGEAEARLFAQEGAKVVVADVLGEQAEAVDVTSSRQPGRILGRCHYLWRDFSNGSRLVPRSAVEGTSSG